MAAKDDGESVREEGDHRMVDLALQAVHRGTGKRKWSFGKGQSWNEKGYQGAKVAKTLKEPMAERQWQARKQGAREKWKKKKQNMLDLW